MKWLGSSISLVALDEEVLRYAYNAFYLPPLIIKPRTVRHNHDSGYITQRGESLILGFYETTTMTITYALMCLTS